MGMGASLGISVRFLTSPARRASHELTCILLQRGGSSNAHTQDDDSDYESEEEGDGDELKGLKAEGDEPCKLVCSGSVVLKLVYAADVFSTLRFLSSGVTST
jgi:hypothetical protein